MRRRIFWKTVLAFRASTWQCIAFCVRAVAFSASLSFKIDSRRLEREAELFGQELVRWAGEGREGGVSSRRNCWVARNASAALWRQAFSFA